MYYDLILMKKDERTIYIWKRKVWGKYMDQGERKTIENQKKGRTPYPIGLWIYPIMLKNIYEYEKSVGRGIHKIDPGHASRKHKYGKLGRKRPKENPRQGWRMMVVRKWWCLGSTIRPTTCTNSINNCLVDLQIRKEKKHFTGNKTSYRFISIRLDIV